MKNKSIQSLMLGLATISIILVSNGFVLYAQTNSSGPTVGYNSSISNSSSTTVNNATSSTPSDNPVVQSIDPRSASSTAAHCGASTARSRGPPSSAARATRCPSRRTPSRPTPRSRPARRAGCCASPTAPTQGWTATLDGKPLNSDDRRRLGPGLRTPRRAAAGSTSPTTTPSPTPRWVWAQGATRASSCWCSRCRAAAGRSTTTCPTEAVAVTARRTVAGDGRRARGCGAAGGGGGLAGGGRSGPYAGRAPAARTPVAQHGQQAYEPHVSAGAGVHDAQAAVRGGAAAAAVRRVGRAVVRGRRIRPVRQRAVPGRLSTARAAVPAASSTSSSRTRRTRTRPSTRTRLRRRAVRTEAAAVRPTVRLRPAAATPTARTPPDGTSTGTATRQTRREASQQ